MTYEIVTHKILKPYFSDELGHGGPVTVTENLPEWGMNDKLIEAAAELGVKHNSKYNCGNNQGTNLTLQVL